MTDSRAVAFEPTDDQRAVGALAAEIAQREIAPNIAKWDREHTFPRDLYTKLTDAGIMGIIVPEAYGGVGADYVSYALTIEELARADARYGRHRIGTLDDLRGRRASWQRRTKRTLAPSAGDRATPSLDLP